MAHTAPNDDSLHDNLYGYIPSLAAGIIFLILFTVSTILHIIQGFKGHYKWMQVVAVGGLIEMLGWSARIWSHYDVTGYGFIVQTIALIIAPTLFSGALYEMFEVMIALVQPQPTWIHAKRSKTLFATTDFLSVGLQLAGGGYTARATTQHQLDTGAYIIAAGILWQLLIMVGFVGAAIVWWWQVRRTRGWKELTASDEEGEGGKGRMGKMLIGGLICSIAIIIRGIYRTAELAEGFEGEIGEIEGLLIGLDGIPIVIAIFILNFYHPNVYLPQKKHRQRHDYLSAFAQLTAESKTRKEMREKKLAEKAFKVDLGTKNENEKGEEEEVGIISGVEVVIVEEKVIEV